MPGSCSLETLAAAVAQAGDGVMITTPELDPPGPEIIYVNAAFEELTGYTAAEVMGHTPRLLQGPATERAVLDELRTRMAAGERFTGQTINYRKDGTSFVMAWTVAPVTGDDGAVEAYVAIQRDVTARARAEQFSRTLLTHLGEGVFGFDAEGRFTFVNPAAAGLLGYDSERELLGRDSHELTHHTAPDGTAYPPDRCPIHRVVHTGAPIRAWHDWFQRRDGTWFPVGADATPLRDERGGVFGGVVVFRDISAQKQREDRLRHQATHDPLTGLPNRSFFEALMRTDRGRVHRQQRHLAVLMLDIDHFKAVNDTHGHVVGDRVLQAVARTAAARMRESDTLARWGGEEFVALLPETDLAGALTLAEAVRARIAETPMPAGVGRVTVSIGAAAYRLGEDGEMLIQRADTALYRAKASGRNCVAAPPGEALAPSA